MSGTQQPEALRLTEIARYCFRSEGMSDPPEQFESPTGDMVDYFDHVEIEKALLARITELESQLAQRFDAEDMATAAAQGFRDGAEEPFCWHWENTFTGGTGTVKKNPETLGINMSHPDYKWTALYTTPQPIQAQADGFFLLLPQRPKPEAPAGTAGLDWDAYSGAQMLAFGRDCSDAAITALRTQQPAPAAQQAGESVYAFRRKGLEDFCTCDEARYEELSNKPHLFETRAFYTAPQTSPTAQAADSVLEDAARSERERICAAIKVEDDYCVEQGDYMLDSDDCIKIARGDWVRPDFSVDAARRKQGARWPSAVRALTLHI